MIDISSSHLLKKCTISSNVYFFCLKALFALTRVSYSFEKNSYRTPCRVRSLSVS